MPYDPRSEDAHAMDGIGNFSGMAWKLLENFPIEEIKKIGAFDKILKTLDKAF